MFSLKRRHNAEYMEGIILQCIYLKHLKLGKTTRLDVELGKKWHMHIGGLGKEVGKPHFSLNWIPGLTEDIIGGGG